MANHKLSFTDNGTKTLLTAGKYCDRNIDVEVNVPKGLQPTKFTNILELDTTIMNPGYRVTSTGYTATPGFVAITFPCPVGKHKVRMRGKYTSGFLGVMATNAAHYSLMYQSEVPPNADGYSGAHLADTSVETTNFGQDEYGDFYLSFEITKANAYVSFSLKDMSSLLLNCTFPYNPILTVDEPIGYVEVT